MLRTIRLNGELGKRFGRVHKLAVDTPAEAIRALSANIPEFNKFLRESDERGVAYRCTADRTDLDDDELNIPLSRTFTITPVVRGAGAVIKIIAGTVLAVVGVFTGQAWLVSLGASIALAGVSQLLAPVPKNNKDEKKENAYFNGPENTTAQGTPVPFGYGELVVGSKVISAGITVEDHVPRPWWLGGFRGSGYEHDGVNY